MRLLVYLPSLYSIVSLSYDKPPLCHYSTPSLRSTSSVLACIYLATDNYSFDYLKVNIRSCDTAVFDTKGREELCIADLDRHRER